MKKLYKLLMLPFLVLCACTVFAACSPTSDLTPSSSPAQSQSESQSPSTGQSQSQNQSPSQQQSASEVTQPTLVSIAITTPPTKTDYFIGERFDNDGMVVTAYYSDESQKNITTYTFSNKTLTDSDTNVEISYVENRISYSVSQEINVMSVYPFELKIYEVMEGELIEIYSGKNFSIAGDEFSITIPNEFVALYELEQIGSRNTFYYDEELTQYAPTMYADRRDYSELMNELLQHAENGIVSLYAGVPKRELYEITKEVNDRLINIKNSNYVQSFKMRGYDIKMNYVNGEKTEALFLYQGIQQTAIYNYENVNKYDYYFNFAENKMYVRQDAADAKFRECENVTADTDTGSAFYDILFSTFGIQGSGQYLFDLYKYVLFEKNKFEIIYGYEYYYYKAVNEEIFFEFDADGDSVKITDEDYYVDNHEFVFQIGDISLANEINLDANKSDTNCFWYNLQMHIEDETSWNVIFFISDTAFDETAMNYFNENICELITEHALCEYGYMIGVNTHTGSGKLGWDFVYNSSADYNILSIEPYNDSEHRLSVSVAAVDYELLYVTVVSEIENVLLYNGNFYFSIVQGTTIKEIKDRIARMLEICGVTYSAIQVKFNSSVLSDSYVINPDYIDGYYYKILID